MIGDGSGPLRTASTSQAPSIDLTVEILRGSAGPARGIHVRPGTLVREVLRELGQMPEGSAALFDGEPVPLDLPLLRSGRLEVVPTFSGG